MDILASILAYLGCVTGIVCALAISLMVYVSPPGQPAAVKPTVATAASAVKVTTIVAQAKPAPKVEPKVDKSEKTDRRDIHVASTAPEAAPDTAAAAPQQTISLTRRKAQISRAQFYRRVVEEQRLKRLAYQQNPDFEARFLGYAD